MTDNTRSLTIDVPESVYDEFWRIKDELAPGDDEKATHDEVLTSLVDRWNGHRRHRPDVLTGTSARVTIPGRHTSRVVYVNINVDEHGRPFEIFITVGVSGGLYNSFSESLAKTISNALRAGVDAEVIADDLMGIRGPYAPVQDNGDDVFSIPDAVGVALKRHVEGKLDPPGSVRGTTMGSKGVTD